MKVEMRVIIVSIIMVMIIEMRSLKIKMIIIEV